MPPQQTGGIPAAHMRALIPPSRMEFHVQRRWAISIFVFLQAWKLSDLLLVYSASYPEQYHGILFKWLLLESCYFGALHVAKIPWLQFPVWKTVSLILFFSLLNSSVFAGTTVSNFYYY